MGFDSSTVLNLRATPDFEAREVVLTWTTAAPAATPFQVYANRQLARPGSPELMAVLPWPIEPTSYQVGSVAPGEEYVDFSATLPDPGGLPVRALLSWRGGTYLDPTGNDDVLGFRIYRGDTAGGAVNYATIRATVPAYPDPEDPDDGYGLGGYGYGGYGRSNSWYEWTSPPLAGGAWNFAVRSYDRAGNESPVATAAVAIAAPPLPPAVDANNRRLTYTFNPGTGVPTLQWLASPSA